MNLSNAAAVATYEAWRQLGFDGAADPDVPAGCTRAGQAVTVPPAGLELLGHMTLGELANHCGIGGWRRLARTCQSQVSATELRDRTHRQGQLARAGGVDLPDRVRNVARQHERQVGPRLDPGERAARRRAGSRTSPAGRPDERIASAQASSISPKVHMPPGRSR